MHKCVSIDISRYVVFQEHEDTYPDIEFYIFVCHRLDIETDGWNGRDGLIKFKFVQNSYSITIRDMSIRRARRQKRIHHLTRLSSGIQAQH